MSKASEITKEQRIHIAHKQLFADEECGRRMARKASAPPAPATAFTPREKPAHPHGASEIERQLQALERKVRDGL